MRRKLDVSREEVVIRRQTTSIEVDDEWMQLYENLLNCMIGVKSTWSITYMLWLMQRAGEHNRVEAGAESVRGFQEYVRQRSIDPPANRTMSDATNELVESGMLMRLSKGVYEVNPILWYQGTMESREQELEQRVHNGKEKDHIEIEDPASIAGSIAGAVGG